MTEFNRDAAEKEAGDAAREELIGLYRQIVEKLNDPDVGVDLIGNSDFQCWVGTYTEYPSDEPLPTEKPLDPALSRLFSPPEEIKTFNEVL